MEGCEVATGAPVAGEAGASSDWGWTIPVMSEAGVAIYQDDDGEWRWRVQAANGEIVAVGEGYTRRADAVRGWQDAAKTFREAWIRDAATPNEEEHDEAVDGDD